MNLPQQSIEQILGSSAVNREFGEKIKELDRRLKMNGMSYPGYESMTDRQQEILTQGLFLEPESAIGKDEYVKTAVDNCGCEDVREDLYHHSPILMREIETEEEKLPDLKIRIGESLSGLDQAIDLLLEQILHEQEPEKRSPQSDLKSYLNSAAKKAKLKIVSSSRGGIHARFNAPGSGDLESDLKPFFKKLGLSISERPEGSISGDYETYILTVDKDIVFGNKTIPQGTQLLYVPVVAKKAKEGEKPNYIVSKALTPKAVGVEQGGAPWGNQESLIAAAGNNVAKLYPAPRYPEWVASQLKQMLVAATKVGNAVPLEKGLEFSPKDLAKISKDYGEILSALWTMSDQQADFLPFDGVEFPTAANMKLVDFFGISDDLKVPVSVKSGATGGKVAITNILEAAQVINNTLPEDDDFVEIAKTDKYTADVQPIYIHKVLRENPKDPESPLGTRAIKVLAKIIGATSWEKMSGEDVKEWLESKSNDELIGNKMPDAAERGLKKPGLLQPLWDETGSTPKISAYISGNRPKMLLVGSPMGSQMISLLNNSQAIQDELNRLARVLTVIQANVNAKTKRLTFAVSRFSEAQFVFDWPGFISGNKIGFRMVINK